MSSQEEQRDTQVLPTPSDPASKIPIELWDFILKDIFPSQLTVLAQVSKTFTHVVRGLSIWRTIWNKAQLTTRETSAQHQDFYNAALASSARICEGCYGYCEELFPWYNIFGSNSPDTRAQAADFLKISRFIDTRALCYSCDDFRQELQSQRLCYLDRYLSGALGGEAYDTILLPVQHRPYILSGDHGHIQMTAHFISHEPVHVELEKSLPPPIRRSKLASKLQEHGVPLRRKSWSCNEYTYAGEGIKPLEEVVGIMVEIDWLHRETQYGRLRNRWRREIQMDFEDPCPIYVKEHALFIYIYDRFHNSSQWSHVRDDPDTSTTPPKSLWDLIEKIAPSVCVRYAVDCIVQGSSNCRNKIFTLTDEQLIQEMNDGAKIARRHLSSDIKLSTLLEQFLGEASLNRFLGDCRTRIKSGDFTDLLLTKLFPDSYLHL